MKKWKTMFRKFLRGHGLDFSHRGRWGVTRISRGETLKNSKWVSHHELSRSRYFQNHLQFWNRMRRNQDNVIWRFWLITKLEVEGLQPVEPKISKWVFSHVLRLDHRTQNIWRIWIHMSRTHFIIFWRSDICQWLGKAKSHKKIAWKLEVLKNFRKLDCQYWDVFYLISASHVNWSWASA